MSAAPRVELLLWEGCPSAAEATALLREEMEAAGVDPASLETVEVETDEEATRERFVGSPTIRVDGRDIEDPAGQPPALTCRIYRLRDGRVSPVPDRLDLREALRAAVSGR